MPTISCSSSVLMTHDTPFVNSFETQTPFRDGIFCKPDIISLDPLNTYYKIGVQAQVFVVVNDEDYYYPDLFRGMIVDEALSIGTEITYYTGSTTGQSVNNDDSCSRYTPVTWQVDRKCHIVSASSFDKMCAEMISQADDMAEDLYPHGSRILVADELAANNHQNMRYLRE
jgi:Delta carbonic anhydrase